MCSNRGYIRVSQRETGHLGTRNAVATERKCAECRWFLRKRIRALEFVRIQPCLSGCHTQLLDIVGRALIQPLNVLPVVGVGANRISTLTTSSKRV
jgi:hypothetical protein